MHKYYKTVWISDIHLGSKDCKADYLLTFLNQTTIGTLYLVGDIVDMWAMSKQFRWPESHNQVLHKILSLSESGCKVIYLPGNHDAPFQQYDGMAFGHIDVKREDIHTTIDGRKLLVLHGDQFDEEVCFGKFHAWIGDKGYDLLLFVNRWYNRFRTWKGLPYRSLAGYLKKHIKGANKAISRYRAACCNRAKKLQLDGVVCGHIHFPEISNENGIAYHNDGDWIESCSALVENEKGNIDLVYFAHSSGDCIKSKQIQLEKIPNKKAA
ncbi:UDP-2,3-diacylglucosamine diphosphatase [Aestuariibacter sp. AA17]|uniref:UDP-2,3-diacylglucosamine diphosphatase n=2 Tax=Fluctibacter corallii TaxID=2984329 RepID=A0ABT3ABS2_9ALTE|nr:UDP-2,3-diacylglucosamine diphosphatase [Aestuariibacter sp. AA17]MCV2886133.1 UDP-2,3-diacylglucosamine diphosphatase [Aestuariibacter sp. AA17]